MKIAGLFCLALLAICMAGCSSSRESKFGYREEVVAPRPPAFLVGPASALLTNGAAFSARVSIDSPTNTSKTHELTGQLLGEGSHLIFLPARADRSFIWDVRERSGYVLSEALQGYAPFSSQVPVGRVTTMAETAGPASERVNGHPGHEVEVAVAMEDGTTSRFSIWRASDINDFPVRIKTLGVEKPFVLNVLDVRRVTLSSNLFLPPDGFTKYSSPDAMAGEIMLRKSKPKKTESYDFGEPQPVLRNSTPY